MEMHSHLILKAGEKQDRSSANHSPVLYFLNNTSKDILVCFLMKAMQLYKTLYVTENGLTHNPINRKLK